MFVYWDSYFILLGLVVQGQWDLAAGMVDNLVHTVEQLGHVPGYISAKTLCRSRSQSPYLTAAIWEVLPYRDDRVAGPRRRDVPRALSSFVPLWAGLRTPPRLPGWWRTCRCSSTSTA
jgi:hypothetical protein